jgi:hypothetical protein
LYLLEAFWHVFCLLGEFVKFTEVLQTLTVPVHYMY